MSFLQSLFTTVGATNFKIDIYSKIRALAVLPGETPCVVSGEESTFQLRHLANVMIGEPIGTSTDVLAVAADMNGKWIVTGATDGFTIWGRVPGGGVPVKVVHHAISGVRAIDISSDSKWVVTGSDARTVDVWDVSTGERRPGLGPLKHEYNVVAVKFCPCGKRIATATLFGSIRIYATSSGQKLLTIPVSVTSTLSVPNITLAWFANRPQIFVVSQGQIKCLNSDDGSLVFQWAIRGVSHPSSVILSPNSKFIAYSVNDTVVIRDTITCQQIGDALQHDGNVSCIAFSPESNYLVAGVDTKFIIWDFRKLFLNAAYSPDTTIRRAESCTHHNQDTTQKSLPSTFSLPLMSITNGAVKPWLHGFLESAEEVLSAEIDTPASTPNHDTLANRALVRGRRLGYEYASMALEDAEQSLSIQTSAIGHIAKTIALIHQKKHDLAKQEIPKLDAFHSDKHTFLLKIVQSILFCLSGEYDKQVVHITKLSMDQENQKLLSLVQANMHLFKKYFEHAMESFRNAHVPSIFPHEETPEMWSISFIFGWQFSGLGIQVQQEKCQSLLDNGNSEAAHLFCDVMKIYHREIVLHIELSDWSGVFRSKCLEKLEDIGDKALHSGDYEEAIRQYKAVEPLIGDLEPKHALLLKRSRAYVELGPENWDLALEDANEAIKLNDSSPWGHERRHAVLYEYQRYHEAAASLDQLVQCLVGSMDPKSIELRNQGVKPKETMKIIIDIINEILSQPRPDMLINTRSGRLCDKQKQTVAFRADPEYKRLILSPASHLEADVVWKEAIQKYFRYSTLSHTWEDVVAEPEFRHVENSSVDILARSFPNTKLQTFCKKTHEHGYWWAWSDTCCINKAEKEVLSMSLRSMYQWYSDSSLTIVHLKGVFQQLDVDLDTALEVLDVLLREFVDCRWNKRAWTLQEYFASTVIQFYTEDWKPYLPIDRYSDTDPINHKTSSAIKRGMQLVTGLDANGIAALKPGADDARQKLRLASTRKATRREDIAYSLFGIFKVSIEVKYGDDEIPLALGRLLEPLLTKSADVTILAWTGKTSEHNTCLPAEITVYHESESLHVPHPIEQTPELAASIPNMRSSMTPIDLDSAVRLHDRLVDSPPPEFHHGRLKLACISFPLQSVTRNPISHNYIATVPLLGEVKIKTADDLSSSHKMVLVHPWFRSLLDPDIPMLHSARQECALRLLAALRQPFGALLLASNHVPRDSYERVAADNLIMVQIREGVSPEQLLEKIHVLHIR